MEGGGAAPALQPLDIPAAALRAGAAPHNHRAMAASAPARYRLRPARPDDAAALAEIERAAFGADHYAGMLISARSFRGHARSANCLIVAEDGEAGGAVAGYALGFVKRGSPYVRFVSLAIGPEHAGEGAGRLLFQGIEDFAREQRLRGVRLEVRADNARLIERYQRIGYTVFDMVEDYYPDHCPAVRLVRDLAPKPGRSKKRGQV